GSKAAAAIWTNISDHFVDARRAKRAFERTYAGLRRVRRKRLGAVLANRAQRKCHQDVEILIADAIFALDIVFGHKLRDTFYPTARANCLRVHQDGANVLLEFERSERLLNEAVGFRLKKVHVLQVEPARHQDPEARMNNAASKNKLIGR